MKHQQLALTTEDLVITRINFTAQAKDGRPINAKSVVVSLVEEDSNAAQTTGHRGTYQKIALQYGIKNNVNIKLSR